MATFVYLEKTGETVTSYREVGNPALYQLDQRREESHFYLVMAKILSQIMEQNPPSPQRKIEVRADELIAEQATKRTSQVGGIKIISTNE